jgi:hypothetical protein
MSHLTALPRHALRYVNAFFFIEGKGEMFAVERVRKFVFLLRFQAGGFPEPELIHYKPKEFDFGKGKPFPLRDQVNPFLS